MKRLCCSFNTKEKAEKVIFSDHGKHKLDWQKYEKEFSDEVEYLVFYTPIQ